MEVWFGYLEVSAGGNYTLQLRRGRGAVAVPPEGFLEFSVERALTVSFPEAGGYPLNLMEAGPEDLTCKPEASLRPMEVGGVA